MQDFEYEVGSYDDLKNEAEWYEEGVRKGAKYTALLAASLGAAGTASTIAIFEGGPNTVLGGFGLAVTAFVGSVAVGMYRDIGEDQEQARQIWQMANEAKQWDK